MKRWLEPGPEKILALIVLGFFLVQLGWPVNLLYPPDSSYSDLMLTHWPNAYFMRQSVWQDHVWPLWNPTQFSGVPFAANPLSGLWYPPNTLLLVLPLTLAFNSLLAFHLCLGGLGMMSLVREFGGGTAAAMVGGLAWALTPKVWAHLGAGHVGLVYAAAWLPWVASAAVQMVRSPTPAGCSRLAIAWALQFLADPRLAAYTAAVIAAAAFWWIAGQRPARPTDPPPVWRKGWLRLRLPRWRGHRLELLLPWLGAGTLALALTAVQWLPLLDYLPSTHRAELTAVQSAVYSLPPWRLMGLLWANQGNFHEWVVYVGVTVLALAILGWLTLSRPARWGVALGLALLVLFALGEYGPLYSLLSRLPGAALLRVPPRVWFLVSFCLAMLAGLGANLLVSSTSEQNGRSLILARYRRGLNRLALVGLSATGMMAAGLLFVQGGISVAGGAWAAFFWLSLLIAFSVASQRGKWPVRVTGNLLILLVAAELVWVDSSLVLRRPAEQLFADGWEVGSYLGEQPGRVYAPSFRPPPQVAAATGIRTVNGVDPLQPADYVTFLSAAAGVPLDQEYSITLPALPAGDNDDELDVGLALANADPSPELLAVLDVGTVVSQFPIRSPFLVELFQHDREELFVYRNDISIRWPAVFHHVKSVPDLDAALTWLQSGDLSREAVVIGGRSLDGPRAYTPAELLHSTPNRLVLRATGPGLLVVSDYIHPGWYATVNGHGVEIVAADGVLRGVYLDEGEHEIEMVYRPRAVTVGAGITAVALLIALLSWWIGRR